MASEIDPNASIIPVGDPEEDLPPSANAMEVIAALRQSVLIQAGLSAEEAKIADDAMLVIQSPQFQQIEDEFKTGTAVQVNIGQLSLLYEPTMPSPYQAMTFFQLKEFVMGPAAFTSREEGINSVLQDIFRLQTSDLRGIGIAGGANGPIALETDAARAFANKAFNAIKGHY